MKTIAIEIDQDELAVRLLEALQNELRPKGRSATELLAAQPEERRADLRRAASVAIRYMEDLINSQTT